ncbi:flavin-containing monooxygenase [Xylogone sp. PMI_703]|nr:flavin-containing monooxygenase [Xylogone sp. PMI_703]
MRAIKRVAVIGAGPAGAIAVDALASEEAFDVIRVFERRERAGGCWVQDPEDVVQQLPDFKALANRTADRPLDIPDGLPKYAPKSKQYRFTETTVYPLLETNIVADVMEYSQEPIPEVKSELSIQRHGLDTPFRHHTTILKYIEGLLNRKGYQDFVEYNTTVEKVEKIKDTEIWRLTLRKDEPGKKEDYWWTEDFDAVVVASGHYIVPYIPEIQGLEEFARAYPGSVEHSKSYRGPEKYRGKKVVVVGASISGPDITVDLVGTAQTPVNAVVRGRYHPYFGETAFEHPDIKRWKPIKYIESSNGKRTVYLEDGSSITNVDHIILATGYSWTMPFLPQVSIVNNRLPGLYLHVFKQDDPTLTFVGAIAAGFTFKVYEWQAVLAARFLAGRIKLPDIKEQQKWEADRVAYKGDGVPFTALYPDFEEYFETVRKLAGEPSATQPGRRLPRFRKEWLDVFNAGHQKRIKMWDTANKAAREKKAREGLTKTKL